ncbi:MAG: hypothetical protein NUV67_05225 [archaeon]|nr:hypothetical protein [archaeon]
MEAVVRVKKVGGSLMARIPKKMAGELNITDNEDILLSVKKRKKSFFGIAPGIGEFTEKDRLDSRE